MLTYTRISLTRFLRALRRSLWILLVSPVIASLCAGAVSTHQVPQYQAQAAILVRAQTPDDQVTQTYANMILQRPLLEQVIRQLRLTEQPERLSRTITVTVAPGTTILNVSVTSSSPQLARDIANTLVNDFIAQVRRIEQQEGPTQNAHTGDNFVVLSPATTPQHPISPNIARDVGVAAAAGLLTGLIIAGIREYLDQTIKSDEELVERVGACPIGHIGYVPAAAGARSELVALQAPSPVAEAYHALRTNLVFSQAAARTKVVLITSPAGNEGKSRTAANLAISLAQSGARTVLIDADFRNPCLDRFLRMEGTVGLSRLVTDGRAQLGGPAILDGLPTLYFVPSGSPPPNPSDVLGSSRIREVLMDLRDQFDYVIVDTPSVNTASDTCALAAIADAAILVVESGSTTYPAAAYAKRALEQVGAYMPGVVINKMRSKKFAYYSYYYALNQRQDLRARGQSGQAGTARRDHADSKDGVSSARTRKGGTA